jgi:hypothetical protein
LAELLDIHPLGEGRSTCKQRLASTELQIIERKKQNKTKLVGIVTQAEEQCTVTHSSSAWEENLLY